MVAAHGQEAQLDAHWQVLRSVSERGRLLDRRETLALVPVLRGDRVLGAVHEPDAMDIDVHALHQGYLRGMRRHGGQVVCDAEVDALRRVGAGTWQVSAGGRDYRRRSRRQCRRRLVRRRRRARRRGADRARAEASLGVRLRAACRRRQRRAGRSFAGIDETWYVKPDAGMLLGSPANADPVAPQDVQPEEMDIALAIDRIEAMTTLQVRRPTRTLGRAALVRRRRRPGRRLRSRGGRASSGSRRRAATASRPRPRWARPAPRSSAVCRCRSASRRSA